MNLKGIMFNIAFSVLEIRPFYKFEIRPFEVWGGGGKTVQLGTQAGHAHVLCPVAK